MRTPFRVRETLSMGVGRTDWIILQHKRCNESFRPLLWYVVKSTYLNVLVT